MPRQTELSSLVCPDDVYVAAGILCDDAGRVLIAQRLGAGPFHGLWEFPGGKIKPGETSPDALSRELAEELGIEVTTSASLMNLRHEYDDRVVHIEFFIVSDWNRDPVGREGQLLRWVPRDRLNADELLPADGPVVQTLQQRH